MCLVGCVNCSPAWVQLTLLLPAWMTASSADSLGCAFSQNYSDVAVGLSNVVKMPFRSWALASPNERTSGVGQLNTYSACEAVDFNAMDSEVVSFCDQIESQNSRSCRCNFKKIQRRVKSQKWLGCVCQHRAPRTARVVCCSTETSLIHHMLLLNKWKLLTSSDLALQVW